MTFVSLFNLIVCCKTRQRQNVKFHIEDYNCICVPRPESLNFRGTGRHGHGGICLLVRESLLKRIDVIETDHACIVWVKVCKDFFSLFCDLYNWFVILPQKSQFCLKNNEIDIYDVLKKGNR